MEKRTETKRRREWFLLYLFGAVQKGIANVPGNPIIHNQSPWQTRRIQVGQQPHSQVPQLHILKVKAGARSVKECGEAWQQQ